MKKKILIMIEEERVRLEKLSHTKNGFEKYCEGGVFALKELTKKIEEL